MQTIKTGVVVALLLAVCYGAFVALNSPEAEVPDELREWAMESEQLDGMMEIDMPDMGDLSSGSSEFAGFASGPSIPGATAPDSGSLALPTLDSPAVNSASTDSQQVGLPALPDLQGSNLQGPELLSMPGAQPDASQAAANTNLPTFPLPSSGNGTPAQTIGMTTNLDAPSLDIPTPGLGSEGLAESAVSNPSLGQPGVSEPGSSAAMTIPKFSLAREKWLAKARDGELRAALENLSRYYGSPELTHAEHSDLVNILDPLSSAVIYSKKHLLLPSHVATASETVASVAEKYSITPELLSKINELGTDRTVVPGTKLKVVQGPFSARISISQSELTVFLGEMYAGRFSVSFGKEHYPTVGTFEVVNRRRDRTYYGGAQTILSAGDPRNPYGGHWISLGELSIHGSPEMASPELEDAGSISLAPLDASDVYDILTQGSQVTIVQ
ncbi:MAG: LysM peptidoglycan-binding domain-containing protein [Aureliella sp.]